MDSGYGQLQRGRILREQRRFEDAEAFLKQAVAAEPENWRGYFELALCYLEQHGKNREGLDAIHRAAALEPEICAVHAVRSYFLTDLHEKQKALSAAETAVGLDPHNVMGTNALAYAYLGERNWAKAEEAARRSLTLEADNSAAKGFLATALMHAGDKEGSSFAARDLLEQNPEDPYAHYHSGWEHLRNGRTAEAEMHFLECLRLNPEFDAGREGLIESYKSRSPLYRLYLSYCFAMSRLTDKAQWVFIIGLYLGFRLGRSVLGTIHPVASGLLLGVYLVFILWIWLANAIGHGLLLLDGTARRALRRSEIMDGILVGWGSLLGLILLLTGIMLKSDTALLPGTALICFAVPASLVFTNPSATGRRLFAFMALPSLLYLLWILTRLISGDQNSLSEGMDSFYFAMILLAAGCTWLGNIPSLREKKE